MRPAPALAPNTALAVMLPLSLALASAACTSPQPEPDPDSGVVDTKTKLEVCKDSAQLFAIDIADGVTPLTKGTPLPITRGFQGFLFVRVGLRAPIQLPPVIKLGAHVHVPGEVDRTATYSTVKTDSALEGGYRSQDVPVFFNDSPLASLVGKDATVTVWTTSTGCRLIGEAKDTLLVTGAYMDEDASFWEVDVGAP